MICTVSGILMLQDGTSAALRTIRFSPNPVTALAIDGSGVLPETIIVMTAADGSASQEFQPGFYTGRAIITDGASQKASTTIFVLSVPDAASATWAQCMIVGTPPGYWPTGIVDNDKLAPIASGRIKGRVAGGIGNVEDLTAAQAKAVLAITSADLPDFGAAVSANAAVTLNTAKATNATHTGDVTGSAALTLATVNPAPGTVGSATQSAQVTVDGKGRVTAAVNVPIAITAAVVALAGGGTAQDYAGFVTRAAFVTWASGKTPAVGSVINAAGYAYRYIGTGTAISDLAGWVPNGVASPDHYATNAIPGTTNMGVAIASKLASEVDSSYAAAGAVLHPNIRKPIDVSVKSSSGPAYRVRANDVALRNFDISSSAEAFGIAVDAAVSNFEISQGRIESDGWAVYVKPASGTGGIANNGMIYGNKVSGLTDKTKVGIGVDGDTRNVIALMNTITDIQRNDISGRYALGMAVAGEYGDIPITNCDNILYGFNILNNLRGVGYHYEDNNYRVGSVYSLISDVERGLEIINDVIPALQYHIGHMVADWSIYALDVVGTGYSEQLTFADWLIDGTGLVQAGPAIRIGQLLTNGVIYDRMHHRQLPGDGMMVTAEGRVVISKTTWFNVVGNVFTGRATSTKRGALFLSDNVFSNVGGIIQKDTSSNVMGDQIACGYVISSIASTDAMIHAKRPGFLTKVTIMHDDAPVPTGANALFSVIRWRAGVETVLIDNFIQRTSAAYNVVEWTAENVQIEAHDWTIGDVILLRCDGAGGSTNDRSATVQIEYFEYN